MSEIALQVQDVSKRYQIYERPQDRLRQAVIPRLERMLGMRRADAGRFFREFWALRNVSLQVGRGEALGILGRNGAGKSTLLQIIAGTLTPSSGTVSLSGKVAALLELGSGFSPDFTGAENIRLNATLLGLGAAQIEERYASIVEFADIGDFIDQPVKTYSSGMLLRVAFAVQTAVEPDILIVDEALAVGDARFQKKCFTRIEQLLARGTTILFVTHDTGTVVQFCSRAVILEHGSVYGDGKPMQIAREYHRLLFDQAPPPAMVAPAARVAAPPAAADGAAAAESASDAAAVSAPASGAVGGGGSARETRYGSRAVEIHAIGIRGPSGTETRVLEIHDTCTFYFRATYRESISTTVGFGFIISNAKGVEVFGTRARQFDRILPPSEQGAIYECAIRVRVPMIPGTYFLTAAIAYDDENGPGEFLDFRFDALEFQVVGHPRCFTTGMVDLDAELTYERLDGARNAVHRG